MRIAIPMFGTRVSPRFDNAPSLMIVSASDGAILDRSIESMDDIYGQHRIGLLSGGGAEVLLCGGIRRCDYFAILDAGIEIYPGLMGEAEDVLDAFLQGRLPKGEVSGPPISVGPRRRRKRARQPARRYESLRGIPRRLRQRGS